MFFVVCEGAAEGLDVLLRSTCEYMRGFTEQKELLQEDSKVFTIENGGGCAILDSGLKV